MLVEGNMQSEQAIANELLVRRLVEVAERGAYADGLDGLLAKDYVGHMGTHLTLDVRSLKLLSTAFASAFQDTRRTINDVISAGDKVVLRLDTEATHSGSYRGIMPTGKRVKISEIIIYRIVDNKVAESWAQADFDGLLSQLR